LPPIFSILDGSRSERSYIREVVISVTNRGRNEKGIPCCIYHFLLLTIEGQAQNYSILTGTVTEVSWRWLVIESNDGRIVPVRVGWRTVYPNHIPFVGGKVKVEYLIIRGVHVAYSVATLDSAKEELEPQKKVVESRPRSSPNLPLRYQVLLGSGRVFGITKRSIVLVSRLRMSLRKLRMSNTSRKICSF